MNDPIGMQGQPVTCCVICKVSRNYDQFDWTSSYKIRQDLPQENRFWWGAKSNISDKRFWQVSRFMYQIWAARLLKCSLNEKSFILHVLACFPRPTSVIFIILYQAIRRTQAVLHLCASNGVRSTPVPNKQNRLISKKYNSIYFQNPSYMENDFARRCVSIHVRTRFSRKEGCTN